MAAIGIAFLLIFLSGYWLRRTGKPYSTVILTIHKLVSVALFVFLAVAVIKINQAQPISALGWIAAAVSAVFFLSLIVSGGLLSTGKPQPAAISTLHRITPYLTVLSSAAALYLLSVVPSPLLGGHLP